MAGVCASQVETGRRVSTEQTKTQQNVKTIHNPTLAKHNQSLSRKFAGNVPPNIYIHIGADEECTGKLCWNLLKDNNMSIDQTVQNQVH